MVATCAPGIPFALATRFSGSSGSPGADFAIAAARNPAHRRVTRRGDGEVRAGGESGAGHLGGEQPGVGPHQRHRPAAAISAGACGRTSWSPASSVPVSTSPDSAHTSGTGRPRLRADSGLFSAEVAGAALAAGADFAIAAARNPAVRRAIRSIPKTEWRKAKGMPGAQVATIDYAPAGWPVGTRMIVRRMKVKAADISTDVRARRP